MKQILFAFNEPVAYLKKIKAIVLAELHIGIEVEFKQKLRLFQAKRMAERVISVADFFKARRIVIVGDVKHEIPSVAFVEVKGIEELFSQLANFEIYVCKGNHDGRLEELIPESVKVRVAPPAGLRLGDYSFFHGHAWPSKDVLQAKVIFTAHLHPVVLVKRKGGLMQLRCWVMAKLSKDKVEEKYGIKSKAKVILLPAFNNLVAGIDVREAKDSIFFKLVDEKSLRFYSLEGVELKP